MTESTTIIKSKNIPELRFKEFKEAWENSALDSKIYFLAGYAFKSTKMSSSEGAYQLIKMSNVYMNQLRLDRNPSFWNDLDSKHYKFLLKEGDVVLTLTGTVGKKDYGYSVQIPKSNKFLLNQRLVALKEREGMTCNSFIAPLLKTSRFFYFFFSESKGGTGNQSNVGTDDLKKIRLNFPSLPEQEKIASFLSAVDKKIELLRRKKERLEEYKKGVMQKLFSQEIRFKDDEGNDYPDWEEKRLGELYTFHTTNSLSRDKLNYESGTVYNIHYGDIHTKFKSIFNIENETIPFVNDEVNLSKVKEDSYCKNGDLVMADASEDYADIGKTIELIDVKDKKVLAGLHTFLARPITSNTTIGFFSYLLKSWDMRKQIMVIAQGSKVLSLSTGRVGKLKLKLPVVEEQQKISDYLSSIDKKIETVNHQITHTQTFKKGLLQGMFV